MRKLTKIILLEVEVGNLKIRSRGDNRCESAKSPFGLAADKQRHTLRMKAMRKRCSTNILIHGAMQNLTSALDLAV
jgi:hypothetical protein